MFEKIIENKYKKKYELQKKTSLRYLEKIDSLKEEIEQLKKECEEKDKIISKKDDEIKCVEPLKKELMDNIDEARGYKEECKKLLAEMKKMKTTMDKDLCNGKWKIIRFLIK